MFCRQRGQSANEGERIGTDGGSVVERESGREHNVSHSARSCIFYDMASNLTSRAGHNSRSCVQAVRGLDLATLLRSPQ